MSVKIRLMRIGAKKRPFYRVVAVDERKKRTGGFLENLGTYNPLTQPKEVILKQDRIDDWLKRGAVPSNGFLRITGQAPQRPPRKAKKEPKPAPETPQTQPDAPTEQPVEETGETQPKSEPTNKADTPTKEISETSNQTEAMDESKDETPQTEVPEESSN